MVQLKNIALAGAVVSSTLATPLVATVSALNLNLQVAATPVTSTASALNGLSFPATTTSKVSAAATTTSTSTKVTLTSTTTTVAAPAATTIAKKRGIPYNNPAYTPLWFWSFPTTWIYNWGQTPGASYLSGPSTRFEFIPMLWSNAASLTSSWATNAATAIASGTTALLAFNEPDLNTQSNMDPVTAAKAYMQYMQPFAGQAKLVSPAVTNGGAPMGLAWMQNFLGNCSACTVDYIALHWYDSATNFPYLQWQLTQAWTMFQKPIWLTEFGASGTDAQVSAFLQQAIPWLDAQPWVARYSYFMAAPGIMINSTTNQLSGQGFTYATYI